MPRAIFDVIKNLFRKPATVKYPYVRVEPPDGFRGRPIIDKDRCIKCWLCISVCPNKAISVDRETDKPRIWLGRCVFCGECASSCPTRAITMSKQFELATFDKEKAVSR
jgi:formate hydrogenlyase subunit 6/NADH:ubiquinone oxidoreductase subunit I